VLVRRPRCFPGNARGPAGKYHWARARPAGSRLAGEADGKSPGPALVEGCDDASISNLHYPTVTNGFNEDKRNDEAKIKNQLISVAGRRNTVFKSIQRLRI